MIRNWERHSLYMDFSNLDYGWGRPSDIDMFLLCPNETLIIGEIKNEKGYLANGQRRILEKVIDNWRHNGACLYIQHSEYVENGSKMVDVASCYVKEYYWNGRWVKPHNPITVRKAIEILIDE